MHRQKKCNNLPATTLTMRHYPRSTYQGVAECVPSLNPIVSIPYMYCNCAKCEIFLSKSAIMQRPRAPTPFSRIQLESFGAEDAKDASSRSTLSLPLYLPAKINLMLIFKSALACSNSPTKYLLYVQLPSWVGNHARPSVSYANIKIQKKHTVNTTTATAWSNQRTNQQ